MLRKLAMPGLLLIVLAPSAYLAWTFRAMPHLGYYHDDSLYWVSARSLATGNGYRIESLPGQPSQTKYPPAYAALLSVVWKLDPDFPQNLQIATAFAWFALPVFLIMLWALLRQYGSPPAEQYVLLAVAALSPEVVILSLSLMPELVFTALLLASLIVAERCLKPETPAWLAAVAAGLGALAYLTKSIAAPLLITAPLCFLCRKQLVKAALFLGTMLPAVAGWQWWVARHLSHSWDLVTLYYTNYVGFQIYNVPLRDLPTVLWYNLDGFLQGASKLLIFDEGVGSPYLERVIAIGAIAGCVRLVREKRLFQYPLAAVGMSVILLVWHYPPDQRFVFPLYPLLLMGMVREVRNLCRLIAICWRRSALGDRFAAAGFAAVLAGLGVFAVFCAGSGIASFIPDVFSSYRADLAARRQAYQWIQQNVPADANVYAYSDPLLFLYTERRSCRLFIPPKLFYHHDAAEIDKMTSSLADFAHQYQLSYVLLTIDDKLRYSNGKGAPLLDRAMDSDAFRKLYDMSGVQIYEVKSHEATIARAAHADTQP